MIEINADTVTAITATVAVCSFLVAFASLLRNMGRDTGESAERIARIDTNVLSIIGRLDKMEDGQQRLEVRVGKAENRISHLEERVEVPIRRLDRLEEKINVIE